MYHQTGKCQLTEIGKGQVTTLVKAVVLRKHALVLRVLCGTNEFSVRGLTSMFMIKESEDTQSFSCNIRSEGGKCDKVRVY